MGIRKGEAPAFLANAIASDTDRCIRWPYGNNGSHPTMTLGTKRMYAHVIACVAGKGERPDGTEASHLCGHSLCINPRHLAWESHAFNCKRRGPHGTQPRGESHGQAKLNWEQVTAIRTATGVSQDELARQYGISQSQISLILLNKRWIAPGEASTP